MGKMTGIAVLLFLFQLSVLPQIKTPAEEVFRRVELISPWYSRMEGRWGAILSADARAASIWFGLSRGAGALSRSDTVIVSETTYLSLCPIAAYAIRCAG